MILRKPYGFLIKYFKVIHLVLTALYIYLVSKVNGIFQYYDNFIRGTASRLDAMSYVTDYYIIALVLSIFICLVIYALMRYKKKPRFLYLFLIVLYFVVGGMIQVSYEGLHTIYISVLETKTLRLYRDLLQIVLWIQYLSIVFVLIRGLGFDIKKFSFVKDLQELDLDVSDEEEVELTLSGTETTQRRVHRGFREFKYYYLENKLFIHIILIVLVVIGIGTFTIDKEIVNKVYEEGEVFSTDDFSFQVLDTYVTTKDDIGNTIGDLKHSFVVLRMRVQVNNGKKALNTANLILNVNHNDYAPEVRYASKFSDLGKVYTRQEINANFTYLFLFPVLKEDLNSKMQFIYAGDKKVTLNPIFLDEVEEKIEKYEIGSKIDFSKSSLSLGYFKIDSYKVDKKFTYTYQYEIRGESYKGNISIASNDNAILYLKIDSNYSGFTNYEFLSRYATLKYKVGEKEYTSVVFSDKTPGNSKDELYLSVEEEIMEASSIWFDIQIRNKKYLYVIK